jgi:hypothetical protein
MSAEAFADLKEAMEALAFEPWRRRDLNVTRIQALDLRRRVAQRYCLHTAKLKKHGSFNICDSVKRRLKTEGAAVFNESLVDPDGVKMAQWHARTWQDVTNFDG